MTMTVDEALSQDSDFDCECDDCTDGRLRAFAVLKPEVERLRETAEQAEASARGTRAELKRLGQSYIETRTEAERLQAVVADQALTIGTLKDELGASRDSQRSDEERYKRAERVIDGLAFRMKLTPYEAAAQVGFGLDHVPETFKLREEAQTARLALDVAMKEIETLNTAGEIGGAENQRLHAKLKWFEEREPLVRALCGQDAPAIAEFEFLNPKPGAATCEQENPDGR